MVDEETAAAIRQAWDESGELGAIVELRRHFPLISDHANARRCVHAIVGWGGHPVRPRAGEHEWREMMDGLPRCALCGVARRRDGSNKPCRGKVRLKPAAEASRP